MTISVDLVLVEEAEATPTQKLEMHRLQIACFSAQVTSEEAEEDFNHPPAARVLAYHLDKLVACAPVFKREVKYGEQQVVVGGFGPCTHPGYRGHGIGTLV